MTKYEVVPHIPPFTPINCRPDGSPFGMPEPRVFDSREGAEQHKSLSESRWSGVIWLIKEVAQ